MSEHTSNYSSMGDWDHKAKQPGLEVKQTWMGDRAEHQREESKQPSIEAFSLPGEDHRPGRTCGLRPVMFWLVVVLLVLIVGGAIGGGIGGWIATHPSSAKATSTSNLGPSSTSTTLGGPTESALASCSSSYDGQFNLRMINATTATTRDEGPVYCDDDRKYPCVETLTSGALLDRGGAINFVNCNGQLSASDDISDDCTKVTEFSVCSNGSLAVGGSALWYQCYNDWWDSKGFFIKPKSERCYPLYLSVADV